VTPTPAIQGIGISFHHDLQASDLCSWEYDFISAEKNAANVRWSTSRIYPSGFPSKNMC